MGKAYEESEKWKVKSSGEKTPVQHKSVFNQYTIYKNMTIFVLEVKATFENVSSMSAKATQWCTDVRNPLNDYEVREDVTFGAHDEVVLDNDHQGTVNFKIKWDGANKWSTLTVMRPGDKALKGKKKGADNSPRDVTTEEWTPVLAVDCRGLEPSLYKPQVDDFSVLSEGGTKFEEEVDLTDEWAEYCEASEMPVGISDFEHRWRSL